MLHVAVTGTGGALYSGAGVPSWPDRAWRADTHTLFEPGRNCVAATLADEVTLLVDAAAYFRDFMRTALLAHETLYILGWDFHSRTPLLCEDERLSEDPRAPHELGDFLNYLCRRRPRLRIRILVWDFPTLFGAEREFPLFYGLRWAPHPHIDVRYDRTHPLGGSHHQKVVVVDDRTAFCGGIDLTGARWDTCEHRGDDPHRRHQGKPYAPMHDLMLRVTGETACALGALARQRWRHAGGSSREPRRATARRDARPANAPGGAPHARRQMVAVSRTFAPQNETGVGVREVEELYLDMIRAARHSILIENQYFTSSDVGDALARRLAEPDGPEVVVVLRLLSHGWLEELTMERLRSALIRRLQECGGARFRVYYPHVEDLADGMCLDVHSKLMIVDDTWLRVGSANLANRSMHLDSECDLTVEALQDAPGRQFIRHARATLLGEHLGCAPAAVEQAIARRGSLIDAIETLRHGPRSLVPLPLPDESQTAPEVLAQVGDPEQPVSFELLRSLFSRDAPAQQPTPSPRHRPALRLWIGAAVVMGVALACTLFWKYSPMGQDVRPERVVEWAREFGSRPWAPLVVLLAYTPGCLVFFPRPLITLFAVVTFGPWLGCIYSLGGLLVAAAALYGAGRLLDRQRVERFAGEQVHQMMQVLRRRGLIAMTALRLVPLAPFSVEGVLAGAIRISFWQYLLGTALGMLPGTLAATVFSDQIDNALQPDAAVNYWLLALVALLLIGGAWFVRRWFQREQARLR